MAYNDLIVRNAGGVSPDPIQVPEQVSRVILQETVKQSAVLNLATTTPMAARVERMPAIDMFPTAFWLGDQNMTAGQEDVAKKQTTSMKWKNISMEARELAVMVPVPDAYVADTSFDLLGMIAPRLGEAIGVLLDQAVLFNVGNPWANRPEGKGIYPAAVTAGNTITAGHVVNSVATDAYANIAEAGALLANLGFDLGGAATQIGYQWELAQARTTQGVSPYADAQISASTPQMPYGLQFAPVNNGAWDLTRAKLIVGDWSKCLIGIRQDITMKVFDSGVIQDNTGAIVYNSMQQDGKVLRVTARFAFATLAYKTILHQGSDAYPFVVIRPAGAPAS